MTFVQDNVIEQRLFCGWKSSWWPFKFSLPSMFFFFFSSSITGTHYAVVPSPQLWSALSY